MNSKMRFTILGLLMLILSISAVGVGAQSSADEEAPASVIAYEIAEDGTRFKFDDLNLLEDGMPGYGSAFVTQGYIYPVGTLSGTNGALASGEPEFPDLVLGEWTCYGWMIGDGAHTTTGEWVISTQVYKFNDGSTIITDGFELIDFEVPATRAITGGTGEFSTANGEQVQILHGFTETMGVNLTVEFHLDSPAATEMARPALGDTLSANWVDLANWD